MPDVVIIMGSRGDLPRAKQAAHALATFGLSFDLRVASAHKSPLYLLQMLHEYEQDDAPKVFITIAGRSNALSGFVDAAVAAPVIACPPPSESFGGADIYSSLRMPSGVAPAVVLEPEAAALLAAKILGRRAAVRAAQTEQAARIAADDQSLREEGTR
jgi:5-(carboxyamino)imidazole ribonucleotide mutase